MSSERNLGDSFQQYFEITPALSQDDREDVFRIRHEVYCRDLGWEPLRADGMETDAFDAQSVHCLLRHRGSGMLVGCTRLILADATQPQALLPFEESCAEVIDRRIADPAALPREQVAEVSRLAVMRDFRQRKGEQQSGAGRRRRRFRAARTAKPLSPSSRSASTCARRPLRCVSVASTASC
jgi:N-acyl amino acid synthase of PEP-CTERM/exosortase system